MRRALHERDEIEVDDEPAAGALGDVERVRPEPVGQVEHRVRHGCETPAICESLRRRSEPPGPERDAGGAERPRDNEQVAGNCTRAARHPFGAAERRHGEHDEVGASRVSAADRHTRFVQPLVQLDRVIEIRRREGDDECDRVGTRSGEVAEVDGGRASAEVAPRDQVEAKVDALDEGVLRDDEPLDLRGVVLAADDEPAPLELGEELELPHSASMRVHSSSVAGSSAYSASYSRAWNVPGPAAPAAASSAATPNAASASAAASSGAFGFAARKQPVRAEDMQPVPVTVASSASPFDTASTRSPSDTWSTGPVTDAMAPSRRAASRASSGGSNPVLIDSTPRTSAAAPTSVAISPGLPRRTVTRTPSRIARAVLVR